MGIRPGLSPANAPAATGPAGRPVSSIGHRGSLDPSPGGWFTAPLDVLSVVLQLAGANVALAGLDRGVARRGSATRGREQLAGGDAAERRVQELHRVERRERSSCSPEFCTHLDEA